MDKLERAAQTVIRSYLPKIKITYKQKDGDYFEYIEGPEKIFEHGCLISEPLTLVELMKLKKLSKSTQVMDHIEPILDDVLLQNSTLCPSYLTNRDIDLEIIQALNDIDVRKTNQNLLDSFSHYLPFINGVNIKKVIKLRRMEGESFLVYRDALRNALKTVTESGSQCGKEIFDDIVVPELNKINLTIKNSRKLLNESIATNILISTGFICIGLFGGLLPPNFGKLLATLGGFTFIGDLLKQVSKMMKNPDSIRDSKYYFLWNVQKKAIKL